MLRFLASGGVLFMGLCNAMAAPLDAAAAEERARTALANALSVAPGALRLISIEPARWNDSSLGCGQPGRMYLQVITEGHALVLENAGQRHRVHVADKQTVVCDRAAAEARRLPTRAQGLRDATAAARRDLANRLGESLELIRVVHVVGIQLDASALCESPHGAGRAGYKLGLEARGRTYTYHAVDGRAAPCPPIESE